MDRVRRPHRPQVRASAHTRATLPVRAEVTLCDRVGGRFELESPFSAWWSGALR